MDTYTYGIVSAGSHSPIPVRPYATLTGVPPNPGPPRPSIPPPPPGLNVSAPMLELNDWDAASGEDTEDPGIPPAQRHVVVLEVFSHEYQELMNTLCRAYVRQHAELLLSFSDAFVFFN